MGGAGAVQRSLLAAIHSFLGNNEQVLIYADEAWAIRELIASPEAEKKWIFVRDMEARLDRARR